MKSLLICTTISLSVLLCGCVSQQMATKEEMTHEYIIEYPGLTKDVIFTRTLKWIANNFKSAKHVIEYQDKDAGVIVGNGVTDIKAEGALLGVNLEFTINIDIKDYKARYRFINLNTLFDGSSNPMPNTQAWHRPAKLKFDEIVGSLKAATTKSDNF
jgi:Domain of unknown function (DUF4468) with TBP-like fold